ncbi:unnamed protein product [Orchesella dallaii]|uniref:Uncharacterized protein n=1 Tax=Orchesella dallaii TaxID=48710 RepID=A0ABP1R7W1_9HEXA
MSEMESVSNRKKELEEENKMLKQFLITQGSSAIYYKIRLDVRLVHERVSNGLKEFAETQERWVDRSTGLFKTIFESDCSAESMLLYEQWQLILKKYKTLKKNRDNFLRRLERALNNFQKTEATWSDTAVELYDFAQKMSPKQRKKLIKKCRNNEDIARQTWARFETVEKDWCDIQADLQDCLDQVEKSYEVYQATKNE